MVTPMTNAMQFAVGGLTLPPKDQWILLAERVRGRMVREHCRHLTGDPGALYGAMTAKQRSEVSLISGKDPAGKPLRGHLHTYFVLWPDEQGQPARFIVWRREIPFSEAERCALLEATRKPVMWEGGQLYLVRLPLATRLPQGLVGPAMHWESALPFVPPAIRHRFRAGRVRRGETPELLAQRLLSSLGFPHAQAITARAAGPVRLHQTRQRRLTLNSSKPFLRTGYELLVSFPEPFTGPILIGDSCHFGLGLFRAVEGTRS